MYTSNSLPGFEKCFLSKISSLLFISYNVCQVCAYSGIVVFKQGIEGWLVTRPCLLYYLHIPDFLFK